MLAVLLARLTALLVACVLAAGFLRSVPAALALAHGILLAVEHRGCVWIGRSLALDRTFPFGGCGLFALGGLLTGRRLLTRCWLFFSRLPALSRLVQRLFALGRSGLPVSWSGTRLGLLSGLFGRCGLLLLPVALLSARCGLLFVARGGGLLGGRGFDLLLLVALLSARLELLLVVCRGRLFRRCGLDLLPLLVALLLARSWLGLGWCDLFGWRGFGLLLLAFLPGLLLGLGLLFGWRGFGLLLLAFLPGFLLGLGLLLGWRGFGLLLLAFLPGLLLGLGLLLGWRGFGLLLLLAFLPRLPLRFCLLSAGFR
ncbi:hypothetical protein GCM10010869_56820 [Mesorhizobium tianshanense]|nr:hypothetical protein GCM10010869_56820 [Mesorhizobium tianshanense]